MGGGGKDQVNSFVYPKIVAVNGFDLLKCMYFKQKVNNIGYWEISWIDGARCSCVVTAFAHGTMGRKVNPSWGGPIELFLVPATALRLV